MNPDPKPIKDQQDQPLPDEAEELAQSIEDDVTMEMFEDMPGG